MFILHGISYILLVIQFDAINFYLVINILLVVGETYMKKYC